jgi:hypothetical protein
VLAAVLQPSRLQPKGISPPSQYEVILNRLTLPNRRQLLLFAPSLLLFVCAGHNLVKKHRQHQEQIAISRAEEIKLEPVNKGSRMPAAIPTDLPPVQMEQPFQKEEPTEEPHSNLIEDRREALRRPCHFGDECPLDTNGKSEDLEKLQDYADRNCAGKALSTCDSVLGDLTLGHENPMYVEARHMMTLSCENDTLVDCEEVAHLEELEGNIEAARDYADFSCSHGDIASCKHIVLLDIANR